MEKVVAFLGRQPKISIAELESLYSAKTIVRVVNGLALLDIEPTNIHFQRIGGTSKMAEILVRIDSTELAQVEKFLRGAAIEHAQTHEGKLTIGISCYDLGFSPKQIQKLGLGLKSILKKSGHSVRLVPTQSTTLSDAQVLHNKLANKGWELCLIRDGQATIVAQTFAVQDIESYTFRDRSRPARDAKVGMLPPKLAQILVNLATGSTTKATILDPFCGTGVLLQEAALMGYGQYGTDLEPRMIDYTKKNLEWAQDKLGVAVDSYFEVGDATNHQWQTASFSHVASEAYLGQAYFKLPGKEELNDNIGSTNDTIRDFLVNLASQTNTGFRLCIAVPAWADKNKQFIRLPLLDSLEEIGYNRLDFVNARAEDLIYHRPNQVVARELLVLERI